MTEEIEIPSDEKLDRMREFLSKVKSNRYRPMIWHPNLEFINDFEGEDRVEEGGLDWTKMDSNHSPPHAP